MSGIEVPPAFAMIAGALLLPFLPASWRRWAFLVFPAAALGLVCTLPAGELLRTGFYTLDLSLCRVDELSRVFGFIFALIVLVGGIYGFHQKEAGQQVAALLYGGGALGVCFAGDFFALLLFWEVMAVASAYLVWARRTPESQASGFRYLMVHLTGGSLLLAGVAILWVGGEDLSVRAMDPGESLAAWLILAGVAINAAIPPLHAWLAESYPKATVTGAVFMSALTTKTAVYVLARVFPGWELLVYFGVAMALYGVVYAVLANDIRQILAYHIISQVGYMVAGVGIGTTLALNGTAAHAFSHILYKALLFMGAGVVLETTGKSKLTELGGIYREMPLAVWLYMIGAFSISGFPLFNGFISKSIIVTAAGDAHWYGAKFLLLLASVGTFLHTGLKLPYWTWFGRESGVKKVNPLPVNMLVAMAILAFLCTLFGVLPGLLYPHLPHAMEYHPYTVPHLVETTQLLIFTFLAFWWLRAKVGGEPYLALDTDWFYRRPATAMHRVFVGSVNGAFAWTQKRLDECVSLLAAWSRNPVPILREQSSKERWFDPDKKRTGVGLGLALTLAVLLLALLWNMSMR